MKVIFLDFDGVINTINGNQSTYATQMDHFNKDLINNLNNLMDIIKDLKIVISSSWRTDMPDALDQLKINGFVYSDRIIGSTPVFDNSSIKTRLPEIKQWIETNESYSKIKIKYLIIDDELSGLNVLKIDPKFGFNKEALNKALNIFELM